MLLQPKWQTASHVTAAAVLVVVVCLIGRCHAGTVCSSMCTMIDENKCTCTIKPMIAGSSQVGYYVSCSGLGNVTSVPEFACSLSLTEFSITGASLALVQPSAFAGIKAESLWMTGLGISVVDGRAFAGLEGVLRTLSLGYNNIQALAGNTFTNFENLESVVLEHNSMEEIASGLFRNLTRVVNVNMQGNDINVIHGDAFDGLDRLQTLDLSDNSIAELPPNFLIGAAQVRELRLAGNRLTNLISPAFNAMPNMVTLDLSRNLLYYLPSNMLPGCPNLNVLYLSSNNISSISSLAIAALRSLQIINAQNNNIGLIPAEAFLNASALKEVSFAHNRIRQLDPGLFQSTLVLQTLNLSYNSIPTFPDDVFPPEGSGVKILDLSHNRLGQAKFLARLADLITVDISYNQINALNFTVAPQLSILRASYNQLKRFSKDTLLRLPKLRELYLDYNLVDYAESGWFESNPSLQILSLGNNLLSAVPRLNATRLFTLRLNDNRISSISALSCPVLYELYLQNNLIGTVASDMFDGLTNLKILDLSNNSIRSIPPSAFSTVTNLQVLKLADNEIGVVSSENLYGLANLRSLDLSGNVLRTLTYAAMSDLLTNKLTAMYLASNPFICSCEVLWIRGSRVLQDRNDSVCFLNENCYRLMCNPVKPCPQAVTPLYNDGDPFCLEAPVSCPKILTTWFSTESPTTTSVSSTASSLSTTVEIQSTSHLPTVSSFDSLVSRESTGSTRVATNTVSYWTTEISNSTIAPPAFATEEESKKTYIYIIIGIVVGVVLLILLVIIIVCLVRRGCRNKRDSMKQVRDYRGSTNDEIGILKGDQSSELEDPPLAQAAAAAAAADSGGEKQAQSPLPIAAVSDDSDLNSSVNSSVRPRPKGTVGFPHGNFRIPGSEGGRRWRTGGQVDRPPVEFDGTPGDLEPEADNDDDEVPDCKRRKNESQFIDDDRTSNHSGEFQYPAKFTNYLLWRGGHKGPYVTEKLPKEKDDDERQKNKRQKAASEFVDGLETSVDFEDLDSGRHKGDLLWRGGPKGSYKTEKLSKDWDDDSKNDDETKQRKQQGKVKSEFSDDKESMQFSEMDDFSKTHGHAGNLLWRGGNKNPYTSEKLSADRRKYDDGDFPDSSADAVNPKGNVTEFNDEDAGSVISGDFRFPSTSGEGLLWRGGLKKPYNSEKLSKGFCKDEDEVEDDDDTLKEETAAQNQRKGRTSEFVGDEDQLPPLNSDGFRMPTSGTDLLWRPTQTGPYSSTKFAKDCSDEPNADARPAKTPARTDKRRSEFRDVEAAFPENPISDEFRLPAKTGLDLLWRSAAQRGRPYSSEKLSKKDLTVAAADETTADDKKTDRKQQQQRRRRPQRRSTATDFVDPSNDEIYATVNFRFPSTTTTTPGDDMLWRAGLKRPYDTARLPRDFVRRHDSERSSSFAKTGTGTGTSQGRGRRDRRRRLPLPFPRGANETTEYADDSDGNGSVHSSSLSFGGFRIPGNTITGDRTPGNLQWRISRFGGGGGDRDRDRDGEGDKGAASVRAANAADRISLDGMQSRRGRHGGESSTDPDDMTSNLSLPYNGNSFGNFKTQPHKRPSILHWQTDRMSSGFTAAPTNSSSPVATTALEGSDVIVRRNSGSDLSVNDGRKPESTSSDHVRKPYGTAKAATAWKKTQMQNGSLTPIEVDVDC